ncbi:helix-turn-helix domain-containing protein [Limosilactobacillus fermentum]|uniref:helix-turn-helix domain-containing protein n=1 Tax=Limosilactobacillus fermentum TaxID=1613 RepID=UPI000AF3DAFF|nr:helix-turn-helix domain-containing protein [Limosilactobacillus fermentum]MDC6078641.1 helix-turn-helix domain-containing protein [Limosilactobacillus fermentum]
MSHILTLSDRTVIQTLLKAGYSQKQIAEEVGVAPSTINYELKRCPKGYYDADQAQEDCEKKLTHRGRVFDVSTATVQWLSTGFLLVNGIMIPISA